MYRKQNKNYCFIESGGSPSVSYWPDLDLGLSDQFVGVFSSPFLHAVKRVRGEVEFSC